MQSNLKHYKLWNSIYEDKVNFVAETNEMRTENFSNNFNDISKIEPTKMHIKSDTDEKSVCCEQNKTITKINDESTSNDVEHQNVDIFVDNSNAIVTNLNSNENTVTAMEEKICELPEAECFDSTYEETESNNKSIVSVEIKTELCDDSECKYDSYLHNAENVIGKHGSELKTVSLSTISTQTKIYGDIEIKENDTEMTLNKTVCRQNKLKEDELVSELSMSTQTDDEYETHNPEKFIDYLLAKCYKDIPKNVSEAVSRMFEIDQCVLKLTNYRQSLFTKLNLEDAYNPLQVVINSDFQIDSIEGRSNTGCSTQNITIISEEHKKNKIPPGISSVRELYGIRSDVEELRANNIFQGNSSETTKCTKKNVVAVSELKKSIPKNFSRKRKKTANAPSKNFKLQNRNEKILVIKVSNIIN